MPALSCWNNKCSSSAGPGRELGFKFWVYNLSDLGGGWPSGLPWACPFLFPQYQSLFPKPWGPTRTRQGGEDLRTHLLPLRRSGHAFLSQEGPHCSSGITTSPASGPTVQVCLVAVFQPSAPGPHVSQQCQLVLKALACRSHHGGCLEAQAP